MKHFFSYILFLMVCIGAIWLTIDYGTRTHPTAPAIEHTPADAPAPSPRSPLATLLIQIVVILVVARGSGRVLRSFGQPRVIGEMIAGILLGPSFLGWLAPGLMKSLFPDNSLTTLAMFSQIGVILYMFLVGTELDVHQLRTKAKTAVWVSHASILLPFFLGTTVSLLIYADMALPGVSFTAFALFLGVAMSITAFPVLARIVEERRLTQSNLGIISLGCAAVDDVTAWSILAVVLAIVKGDGLGTSLLTLLFAAMFAAVMILLVKPFLKLVVPSTELRADSAASAGLILAFLAGLTTESIGVHAVFGAFLAGTVVPAGELKTVCKARFESVASGFLLPLFFAFTGLRTHIGLLNDWRSWSICLLVIACAVAGKLGGSMAAARWNGMKWRDAFCLGALMNSRGLIELIVLNIGYDLGILSPPMFAVLVLMALTTTVITSPLLSLGSRFL